MSGSQQNLESLNERTRKLVSKPFKKLLSPRKPPKTDAGFDPEPSTTDPLAGSSGPAEIDGGSELSRAFDRLRPVGRSYADHDDQVGRTMDRLSLNDTGNSEGEAGLSTTPNAPRSNDNATHDLQLDFANPSNSLRPFPAELAQTLNTAVRAHQASILRPPPWPESLIPVARLVHQELRERFPRIKGPPDGHFVSVPGNDDKAWLHQAQLMHDVIADDQLRERNVEDKKVKCTACDKKFSKRDRAVLFPCNDDKLFHDGCAEKKLNQTLWGEKFCPLCRVPIVEYSAALGIMRSAGLV